jgi:uncharacterized protein YbbC (DUF1343 family)
MMWGIDRLPRADLQSTKKRLQQSTCAVLTHAPAVDLRGRSLVQVLAELGASPKVIFSPEHGLDGVAQAEEAVAGRGAADGAPPVESLYGTSRESLAPRPEALDGVECLVIDLVDVGARYYTSVWTALIAARAAADRGIHTLVLDRPNPLGGVVVEGKPQREGFLSFVGLESVPIRHGVTVGEMLAVCFERDGRPLGPDGALSVVGSVGWERARTALSWSRPFVPPSPNMPTVETALLYPGGCLVEGTNLSEARGTAFPFRAIGAPFLDGERLAAALGALDLPGVMLRPVAFRPSFEKHAGQVCRGVMLHVTDADRFRPVHTYLALLHQARLQAKDEFRFLDRVYEFEAEIPAFDLLCGMAEARQALLADAELAEVSELVTVSAEDAEFPRLAEATAGRAGAE